MDHSRRLRAAAISITAAILIAAFVLPGAALAAIDGACDGWVEVEGIRYDETNDTPGNPIIIPGDSETLRIAYQGGVEFENLNHSGKIGVKVGPATIKVADWGSANPADTRGASGTYDLTEFWDRVPFELTGIYEVAGNHDASGGSCTGTVFVKFEGNPWGNPIAVGSLALTALSFLGLLGAGLATGGGTATAAGGAAATAVPPPAPPSPPPPPPETPPGGTTPGGGA